MIRKILVGLDKSDLSLKALQQAILFAKVYGAQLKLAYALVGNELDALRGISYFDSYSYPGMNITMLESYEIAWDQFVVNSNAWLGQKISETQKAYANTSGTLLHGNPGAKLCELAETWNADFIIVGSRSFSGIGELLMGSVSNHVMHHAPCSVLLVHSDKQSKMSTPTIDLDTDVQQLPQRILVPVDKSSMAERAMLAAVDLAKLCKAEVKLLHVIDGDEHDMPQKVILSDSRYMLQHNRFLLEKYQHDWNKFIDGRWRWLQTQVQRIEDEGVDAICDVMQGRTGPCICGVAEDWGADLIMIGSRGLTGLKELLVGSVSYYVSHRASCSVLIKRLKHSKQETSGVMHKSQEVTLVNP